MILDLICQNLFQSDLDAGEEEKEESGKKG